METVWTSQDHRIAVAMGDLTSFEGDTIAIPVTRRLQPAGTLAETVHRAAGPGLAEECERLRADRFPDGLPVTEAVRTGPGRLPLRGIVHVVRPAWVDGLSGEGHELSRSLMRILSIAVKAGDREVAVPAVLMRVHHDPRPPAFDLTGIRWICDHSGRLRVVIVGFSEQETAHLERAAAATDRR